VVAPDKFERGCANLSLSSDIIIVSVLKRLNSEVAFTKFTMQKRDGLKNKQKTPNLFVPWWCAKFDFIKLGIV